MRATTTHSRRGFTLIELAIVLAVAGLLFIGLWRLMAGGNQQLRDQGSASQQAQLIGAVKGFLNSSNGQTYMTTNTTCGGNCAPNRNIPLPLPANNTSLANCQAGYADVNLQQFCSFLPSGFAAATANSYGQTYSIEVQRDASAAGAAPATYSFMIMTSGGDTIPDTSGGRISSLIGNDGGFIYSSNVCGLPIVSTACGAFGAWSASVTGASPGYGFASGASGTIASRTYVSPEQSSQLPWLARSLIGGNTLYNTMSANTNLFLGGATNGFYAASTTAATTGGGSIFMQGGAISLQGGSITGGQGSLINMVSTSSPTNPIINLSTSCFKSTPADATCQWGIQLAGDGTVSGLFNVNALYANTFIYQSSDIRLKTDIHPLADPLGDVMKLNPVSFTFKASGSKSLGVIAQEVEKVYPQLVSEGQKGMKSVNYEGLIGPLIGAVQALKKENDDLRGQLHEQALRQEKLEREVRGPRAQ